MKSMNYLYKHAAALSAAVILLQGVGTGLPAQKLIPLGTVRSAADFSAMLAAASEPTAEPFAVLCCDPASGQIICDGRPVGESYGGFTVSDGTLIADSGSGEQLTAEQAATSMGCEIVTEADGTLTVRSPFQTARLVVSSSKAVDPLGGSITAEGYNGLHVIQYDSPQAAYRAYNLYQQDSSIRFVQPDRIRYTVPAEADAAEKSAAEDTKSWGYEAIGTADYLAWLNEHNPELPEITAAVLDSGINAEHSWFRGRIQENGIDCTDSSAFSLNDTHGHGTHCAGIICQNTPESVKILPVKVIADDGYGSDLMIYCGIMYAVEQEADVISMSLGGDGEAPLMLEGIRMAAEADIPCCVAAGNSGFNADYSSPGCYETVFCISAVSFDGGNSTSPDYTDPERYQFCGFSNYGSDVDFTAPGQDIVSAGIDSPDALVSMSGTSMAAPFAAAACADLLSAKPEMKTSELRSMLRDLAIRLPEPNSTDLPAAVCYGEGLINLRGAFISSAYIAPPVISVNGAKGNAPYYEADESVTLSFVSDTPDDPIYYTLDGSEPDAQNGILYTGIPTLTKSAVVRAAVIRSDAYSKSTEAFICIGGKEVNTPFTIENGVLTAYDGVMKALDLTENFSGDYLKAIGDEAFMYRNVESVILPDSVTSVGSRAFYGTPLKQLTGNGVTEIGDYAFADTALQVLVTAKLKKLGAGTFMNCASLASFPALDDSLTEIPDHAFEGCAGMSTLNFDPENLTKIGKYAFASIRYSGAFDLPKLKELGAGAFSESNVTSVTLPETITALDEFVFYDCSGLDELNAPGITELGPMALYGCSLTKKGIDFSKLKKLGRVSLIGMTFGDQPVFFDELEILEEQAIGGTTGGALVFPSVKTVDRELFIETENLIWLPNAESVTLNTENMTGLRVSEKLKSAELRTANCCKYIIGPKDSCIRREAEKRNIPYFPEQTLITEQTNVRVRPGDPFTLYAAYVKDPETWVTWYEIIDGKEAAAAPETVTTDGKPFDLNRSAFTGTRSAAGTYQFRAVLTGPDGIAEQSDFTVYVTENAPQTEKEDLDYTIDENGSGVFKKICTVGETLLFRPTDAYYTFYSDEACRVRLASDNRCVNVNGTLESRVFGTLEPVSDTDYAELHEGFNRLRINCGINKSVFKMPLTFRLEKVQTGLRQAEIVPLNTEYTGKPIRPAFRITMDDKLLEEGKDYLIGKELTFTEAGKYQVTVTGTGDYYGDVIRTFTVLPRTDGALPALTEGTQTVTLGTDPAVYSWTPDKEQYGITAESLHSSILTVYAPDGTVTESLSGNGYLYSILNVEPGKTYRISVSNLYQTETGKVTFSLIPDCRLLDDAEIEITKLVGYGEQPVCTLKDSGTVLKEGTDYTVYIYGTLQHIGTTYLAFRGCGSYIGLTDVTYCIAPQNTGAFPDNPLTGQPEPVTLQADVPVECNITHYPGTVNRFYFTAPYDCEYTLTLPDHEQQSTSVLLYVNDGAPILAEEPEMKLKLKNDDFLQILIISDYLLNTVISDIPRPFTVCVSGIKTGSDLTADGIRYHIENGRASVTGAEPEARALTIPEQITDPVTGALNPVTDIDALAFAPYAETCTIYTKKGSSIHDICEKQDYNFILTDSDFALTGDISGSGALDYHDVILLQKYLTECGDVRFTAAQAAAADLNQDGSIDLRDLFALMQQLDPPAETVSLADLPFFRNNDTN
ncbi:MAG: leucine-rich repeat protein [Oscillospiraceae bacterium]|nr:leucine-rich repeat protein [Oscillospiraceae bacterium]